MPAPEEADVLGVRLRAHSEEQALRRLRELLGDGRPHSVYFVHAATANRAFEDPGYRAVLNRGHLVFNDGVGVKWAARFTGVRLSDNLVGTDLVPALLAQSFDVPLRLYLLGSRPGVAERAAARLREQLPGVEVVGCAPGYFGAEAEQAIVEEIRRLAPDIVLVGAGNPRQEEFIDRRLDQLGCKLAVAVGGLFDHWAGELQRARPWVRRLGIEWFQLLLQQPHKWRRYLLGNPKFLWRVFRPRLLDWAREAAAIAAGLAVALAAAEVIVRLAKPQILERYPEGLYVASTTRQYKLRPHFRGAFRYPEFETRVETNSLGLREDREFRSLHPGIRRALAIGDSFTMAYSVDEPLTWVRLAEKTLNQRRPAADYEVINAGVPGYSTWQELAYLEEEGVTLRPDVVLLGFFIGNDIADNAQPALPVALENGHLVSTAARQGLLPFAFRLALARHSHLYTLARRSSGERAQPDIYSGGAEPGWRATGELLERLARLGRARKFRAIVVLIPERVQVDAGFRRLGRDFDPGVPNRRLRELCRAAGLEWIDLLEAFSDPGLYFPQDGHWNGRGNALAAGVVADYLSRDLPDHDSQ